MEQKHKDLIQQNFSKILDLTHIDVLLPKLEAKGIFPEVLIEEYKMDNMTSTSKKEKIFLDIQKRGPDAFQKLLEACQETGHQDLYKLLSKNNDNASHSDGLNCTKQERHEVDFNVQDNITLGAKPFEHRDFNLNQNSNIADLEKTLNANYGDTVNLTKEPKQIKVKPSIQFMDDPYGKLIAPYPMRSPKRGVLFMVTNKTFLDNKHHPRAGAEVDEANLKNLFSQFNFEIFNYENQTFADMYRKIDKFSKDPILDEVDCCFVIIMSHGEQGASPLDTQIVTYDDKQMSTFDVIEKFNNYNCPRLQNKPKVFIFQMCRGSVDDYGTKFYSKADGRVTPMIPKMPVATDICVCYTAYPGYKSYRDPNTGSWFIEVLCDVFMDHACDTHVQEMLKVVAERIRTTRSADGRMQVTELKEYNFRPCYLNPGLQRTETHIK